MNVMLQKKNYTKNLSLLLGVQQVTSKMSDVISLRYPAHWE